MDTTTPPPPDQPAYRPPAPAPERAGSDGFFDAMRRIGVVRTQDRWIGGVAGGVALRFGVDPLLVRGIFGVTALFGGAGLVVYGLAWALLPEQVDGRIHVQETLRGRFNAGLLGAIALFLVGISRGDGWFGWGGNDGFGWLGGFLWFAAIATVVVLVISAANRRGDPPRPAGPPAPSPTYAAPPNAFANPTTVGYAGYAAGSRPAPVAGGYAGTPGVYAPLPPPLPPRPRVLGPGAAAIGAVVGLTLVAFAVLLIVERQQGNLDLSVGLTAVGIGIVLAGLGVIVAGMRGRKSGTLGFLAVVGIVVAVPAAAFTQGTWRDGAQDIRFAVSDGDWAPTSLAQARDGLWVAVGDVDVDLTQLATDGEVVRVPVSLGAGQLTVTVPRDTPISAEISIAAGDIRWDVDDAQRISGVSDSSSYDFESNEVTDGASPELVLRLESGAGEIRVVEEN